MTIQTRINKFTNWAVQEWMCDRLSYEELMEIFSRYFTQPKIAIVQTACSTMLRGINDSP